MAREPLPCGTEAAYQRHRRAEESPCEPCVIAHRELKATKDRERRAADGEAVREAIDAAPSFEEIDPLAEALDNLRIVRAVLTSEATPANTIAALTKRRDDLVDRIQRLRAAQAPVEVSRIDELTSRRRERRAAATG